MLANMTLPDIYQSADITATQHVVIDMTRTGKMKVNLSIKSICIVL